MQPTLSTQYRPTDYPSSHNAGEVPTNQGTRSLDQQQRVASQNSSNIYQHAQLEPGSRSFEARLEMSNHDQQLSDVGSGLGHPRGGYAVHGLAHIDQNVQSRKSESIRGDLSGFGSSKPALTPQNASADYEGNENMQRLD